MMVLFGIGRLPVVTKGGLTLPDFSGDAVTQKQQWAALMREQRVFWHLDSKDKVLLRAL
jgi:hypothetical protein